MVYEYKTKKGGSIFYPADIDHPIKDIHLTLWNGFDREKNMWVYQGKYLPKMIDPLYKIISTNTKKK